jgi:hypothetical protein
MGCADGSDSAEVSCGNGPESDDETTGPLVRPPSRERPAGESRHATHRGIEENRDATSAVGRVDGGGVLRRGELRPGEGQPTDWGRFYYYPYVYYPHNFQAPQQYNHLYHRYAPPQQIPVYNKDWYNFYPTARPYHMGHHFILDVF